MHDIIHSLPLNVSGSLLWRSLLLVPQSSQPLLAVGWTLVFEMYFYLVFAAFLALRISIIVGLIGWSSMICGLWFVAPYQIADVPALNVVANPMTIEFMVGAVIGILWLNGHMPLYRIAGIAGLIIAAISIGYLAPELSLMGFHLDVWRVILFGIPAGLILYALAAIELKRPSSRVPGLAVKLGDWSYATYLTHLLVFVVVGKAMSLLAPDRGVRASLALVVAGLISANLVGAGAHIFFERPTLKWLHKLGGTFRRPVGKGSEAAY